MGGLRLLWELLADRHPIRARAAFSQHVYIWSAGPGGCNLASLKSCDSLESTKILRTCTRGTWDESIETHVTVLSLQTLSREVPTCLSVLMTSLRY